MKKLLLVVLLLLVFSCGREKEVVYVDPSWDPEQLLAVGNEYLQIQDYDHAEEAFLIIYNNYPTSRVYTDAMLGLAYVYGKKEQYEKQMDMLLALVSENLVPSKIPAIYNQLAEFYEKTSAIIREINPMDTTDLAKAREYYQKSVNYALSSDTLSKAEAIYKSAMIDFQLGHREKGLQTLQELTVNYAGNPWAFQAKNFLQTYQETGILPGMVQEESILQQTSPEDSLPVMPEAVPSDTTMKPDSSKKSILEEIPTREIKKETELDSLIEKL